MADLSDSSATAANVTPRTFAGRGTIAYTAASAVLNLSSFVFHLLVSRQLGPSSYGEVAALLNLVTIIGIPFGALQAAVVQQVVMRRDESNLVIRGLVFGSLLCSLGLAALFALFAPFVASFLAIGSLLPLILLSLYLTTNVVTPVLQGSLIGRLRFEPVAGAIAAGAIVKLTTVVAFDELHFGVSGAVLATVAGTLVTCGWLVRSLRGDLVKREGERLTLPVAPLLTTLVAMLGNAALVGVDTVICRHIFDPRVAGQYAAAAVAGRIAMFLPSAVTVIIFPRLVADRGTGPNARRNLFLSGGLIALAGLMVAAVMGAFPRLVVSVLFGASYAPAAHIVFILSLEATGLGLVNLLTYFHVARRSTAAWLPWGGVIGAIGIGLVAHPAPHQLALTMLALVTLVVIAMGFVALVGPTEAHPLPEMPLVDEVVKNPAAINVPDSDVDLTLVLPHYNAGPRLRQHTVELLEVLSLYNLTCEIIAVSDGSEDGSDEGLEDLGSPVKTIRLDKNMGKGVAVRVGLAHGRGEYVGFIDGDGDIPASVLHRFVAAIAEHRPDIVIGSKRHPESEVVYPPLRRVYSWLYQLLNRVLFELSVRDTQTGVKLASRRVLLNVLPVMEERGYAFDLEFLAVAKRFGYGRVLELPVEIRERLSSNVSPHTIWTTLLDTLAIFWRLRVARRYDDRRLHPAVIAAELGGGGLGAGFGASGHDRVPLPIPERNWEPVSLGLPLLAEQPLRILVCNWRDLAHPLSGGAEVWTHHVTSEWTRMGHQVTWFCAGVDGVPEDEDVNGVRIVRRGSRLSVYKEARRFFEAEGGSRAFDLVVDEVNTLPFGAPKWAGSTPVLAVIHQLAREVWFYETPLLVALGGRYVIEPWLLRAYRNVPVSTLCSSGRASLERAGLRNVSIVPAGYTPGLAPTGSKEIDPTLLYVGRLAPNKRPGHVIEAFRSAQVVRHDLQLWIVGSGPLYEELERSAPDGVRFFGRVSNEEKRQLMARAHALVVPSVREGWALTVTEAAEVGTPTIGYDVCGLTDSIRASGGYLVEESVQALAEAMIVLTPRLASGSEHPLVLPGGVVPWDGVAAGLLAVAGFEEYSASYQLVSVVAGIVGAGPEKRFSAGSGDDRARRSGARGAHARRTGPLHRYGARERGNRSGREVPWDSSHLTRREAAHLRDRDPVYQSEMMSEEPMVGWRAVRQQLHSEMSSPGPGSLTLSEGSTTIGVAGLTSWRRTVDYLDGIYASASEIMIALRSAVATRLSMTRMRRTTAVFGLLLLFFTACTSNSPRLSKPLADGAFLLLVAAVCLALVETGQRALHARDFLPLRGTPRQWWRYGIGLGVSMAAVCQTWFHLGTVIARGDNTPQVGTAWLGRLFAPWAWIGPSLGSPSNLMIKLPWAVFLWLGDLFGLQPGLSQRIFTTILFVGAALAALALAKMLGLSPRAAAIASVCYMLNPATVSSVHTATVLYTAMILLPGLPAIVLATARGRMRLRLAAALFCFAAPLAGYISASPPLLFVVVVPVLVAAAFASVMGGREASRRAWRVVFAGGGLLGLASAFWVVPTLIGLNNVAVGSLSSSSSWLWTESRATINNTLWLNGAWGWKFVEYAPYAGDYKQLPLVLLRYGLPFAGLAALALPGRFTRSGATVHRMRVVSAAALIGLFLVGFTTGTHFPGSIVFDPLYRLPYGWLLQTPTRFMFAAALPFALLVGLGLDALFDGEVAGKAIDALRAKWPRRAIVCVVGCVALALVPGFPLVTGQIVASKQILPVSESTFPAGTVTVPSYWPRMAAVINHSKVPGAVLVLPVDPFYQTRYDWGYYGSDKFIVDLIRRPTLNVVSQGYRRSQRALIATVQSVSSNLEARRWTEAAEDLDALHTTLLLVRTDVEAGFAKTAPTLPKSLQRSLARDPLATLVRHVGQLWLYRSVGTPGTDLQGVSRYVTATRLGVPSSELPLYPRGTAIVTDGPQPGVPTLTGVPAITNWSLGKTELSTSVQLQPSGWTYQIADAATGKKVALGSSGDLVHGLSVTLNHGVLNAHLPIGKDVLARRGRVEPTDSWGQLQLCGLPGGSLVAQTINRSLDGGASGIGYKPIVKGGPNGWPAFRLSARGAVRSCVSRPLDTVDTRAGGTFLVNLRARWLAGSQPPEICVDTIYYGCTLEKMQRKARWSSYSYLFSLPPRLPATIVLFASGGHEAATSVEEYSRVTVRPMTGVPKNLYVLGTPTKPTATPTLWQIGASAGQGWRAPKPAVPVTVDGLNAGWLMPAGVTSAPVPHFAPGLKFHAADAVSILAVLTAGGLVAWDAQARLAGRPGSDGAAGDSPGRPGAPVLDSGPVQVDAYEDESKRRRRDPDRDRGTKRRDDS
ncbi:MAG: glycosyltransferase [Acidimicrobiales bacterium]